LKAVLAKFDDIRPAELQKTAADAKPKKPGKKAARKARRQSKAETDQ
jgi:hypothetical protein